MVSSAKQFAYLKEMGIALWQRKDLPSGTATTQNAEETSLVSTEQLSIELDVLHQHRLFSDILLLLNADETDVIQSAPNVIQISDIAWSFYQDCDLSFHNNQLQTTSISSLTCPSAKKQLWQLLGHIAS